MEFTRLIDGDGNFVMSQKYPDMPVRIRATQFETKSDAKEFLQDIEAKTGFSNLQFCCGYGECKSPVFYRSKKDKVAGKKNRARRQTWVSKDINDHLDNCNGPNEQHYEGIPHNGLTLSHAIAKKGEFILFHLNIELEKNRASYKSFNTASKFKTKDMIWRKENSDKHSYYNISTFSDFSNAIAQIITEGDIDALKRTRIAYEGRLYPLREFIVRNNYFDRMNIIEGETGTSGLKGRAEIQSQHCNCTNKWITGAPRLLLFEAAQSKQLLHHPNSEKSVVRGHRHMLPDGRTVFDQLHFEKSDIDPSDFFPNGALVIAIPFIHREQAKNKPMVHWSIISNEQIDFNPPSELLKILCSGGKNIPPKPTQNVLCHKP